MWEHQWGRNFEIRSKIVVKKWGFVEIIDEGKMSRNWFLGNLTWDFP